MHTIDRQELRDSTAEVLRREAGGETILVTHNGQPAVAITPAGQPLRAAGGDRCHRRAARPLDVSLLTEPLDSDGPSSEQLLAQLRADR